LIRDTGCPRGSQDTHDNGSHPTSHTAPASSYSLVGIPILATSEVVWTPPQVHLLPHHQILADHGRIRPHCVSLNHSPTFIGSTFAQLRAGIVIKQLAIPTQKANFDLSVTFNLSASSTSSSIQRPACAFHGLRSRQEMYMHLYLQALYRSNRGCLPEED
jgi:hypothetical protein